MNVYPNRFWAMILLGFVSFSVYGQYQLTGVMINSCGTEGNQEFVTLRTTESIDPSLVNISYGSDESCNTFVVYDQFIAPSAAVINEINTLANCTAFQAATNPIPADSEVFIFDQDFDPNGYENWDAFCGRSILVLFNQLPNPNGNYSNSSSIRFFCTAYDGMDLGNYQYTNTDRTVDGSTASWTNGPGSVNSDIPDPANCGFGQIACMTDLPNTLITDTLEICFVEMPFALTSNLSIIEELITDGSDATVEWFLDEMATMPINFAQQNGLEVALNDIMDDQVFVRITVMGCPTEVLPVPVNIQNATIALPLDFIPDSTVRFCPSDLPKTYSLLDTSLLLQWSFDGMVVSTDTAVTFDIPDLPFELELLVQTPNCPEQLLIQNAELSDDCPCEVIIPNAFTPNGDGENDHFFPVFSPDCIPLVEDFRLVVYNRWGKMVYESQDPEAMGWDGQFNGGEAVSDVYVWIAEYRLPQNDEFRQEKGDMTLIR